MENQSINFTLSLKNLIGIPFDKYEQDFTIIINGEEYKTSRIVADLLSPSIREMHLIDSTVNEFSIDIKNNSTNYFSEFLNLVNFSPKKLDSERIKQFSEFFYVLGNKKEYVKLRMSLFKPITTDNVIDQFSLIYKISEKNDQKNKKIEYYNEDENIESIISYISIHFYELEKEKIKQLPTSIIEEILNRADLKIESEDNLLKLIIEMYEKDEQCSELFEKVDFNNVSENVLEKFIDIFNINDMNCSIWKSICIRLFPSKSQSTKNNLRYKNIKLCKEFKLENGHEFEGIMHYLSKKTNGNISDNGTIKITSNSIYSNSFKPENVVDYENNYNEFCSKNTSNAFLLFDFKDKSIQLTNYSIRSRESNKNGAHIRNWVVEVSNDEKHWKEVDQHSNDSTLNNSNITATFSVNNINNEFYQFIRLRQTGYSWSGYPNRNNYYFAISFIEFFGILRQNQ